MNVYFIYAILFVLVFSFLFLILILGLFQKIIRLQLKYWLLAKRGYVKIEHVGEDKVIRTYFLKPSEDKFDIDGGFFAFQKDALVKDQEMFHGINKELLSKKKEEELTAEEKEYKKLLQSIGKMKFEQDAVALNWGVPTMFYYGQDVNPIKPSDRKKIYDGKIFKALYMRLLLLKEWKFIRMAFIIIMVCLIIIGGVALLQFGLASKVSKTNALCMSALNESNNRYYNLVNNTLIPAYEQRTNENIISNTEGTSMIIK